MTTAEIGQIERHHANLRLWRLMGFCGFNRRLRSISVDFLDDILVSDRVKSIPQPNVLTLFESE